jgi:dTDP-glucose pyrophosphorylase
MLVLIPMGGKGSRFSDQGYKLNKTLIPVTSRHDGKKYPMAINAMVDVPWINFKSTKIICVNSSEHAVNGLEKKISRFFPQTIFIHDHIKLDQAFGCYLAREFLQSNEELFIGACDNGFDMDLKAFNKIKKSADAIMFSHTNDLNIERNPLAHSWADLKKDKESLKRLSFKNPVSLNPMNDHATTGMFWFKNANVFLNYLEKMIWAKDTIDGKFYVDKILNYYIEDNLKVKKFDVNYICWGTPEDYEYYENTLSYWKSFSKKNKKIIKAIFSKKL